MTGDRIKDDLLLTSRKGHKTDRNQLGLLICARFFTNPDLARALELNMRCIYYCFTFFVKVGIVEEVIIASVIIKPTSSHKRSNYYNNSSNIAVSKIYLIKNKYK